MAEKQLITTSSAACANRCRREYYHSVECGMRAVGEVAELNWGTIWHMGMEHLWSPNSHFVVCDIATIAGETWHRLDPESQVDIDVLFRGYIEFWRESHRSIEPLFVEKQYRLPLINPETGRHSRLFDRAGKLDAGARIGGRDYIVEHKSSGSDISAGSKYWEKLKIDAQCSNYFDGARSFGLDPCGVLYDVVRKPALRRLLATPVEDRKYTKPTKKDPEPRLYANQRDHDETLDEYRQRLIEDVASRPEWYFVRAEIVRIGEEEKLAAQDNYDLAQSIHQNQLRNRWPRNTGACERWGRMCQFWDVCTGAADINDTTRFKFVGAHQELGNDSDSKSMDNTEGELIVADWFAQKEQLV